MLTRIYFPLRFTHLGCISWKNYVSWHCLHKWGFQC
jgi:hypothetical protein